MNDPFLVFYQVAMVMSLLGATFVVGLVWRSRNFDGAKALIALVISTFIWTFGFFLEANSRTLEQQLFFNNIGYLGSMSVPVFWFIFAWQYTSSGKQTNWTKFIPLFIFPLVITVMIWSNSYHYLMWSNEHLTHSGPFLVTAKTYGPFFWAALVYGYVLVFLGAIQLVKTLIVGAPLYTNQTISLIIAASVPFIWNTIYVFNLVPMPRKDLTPAAFTVSEIAIALGLIRFRLFKVVPFARRLLAEQLSDGFLVFNSEYRLLEINPAALRITGTHKNVIGKELDELITLSPVFEQISKVKVGRIDLSLIVSGKRKRYEMEIAPMHDDQKRQIGLLVTLRDITTRTLLD